MAVTIKDVASRCGVSITTVSRFINGKFDNMAAPTQERIRLAIEELNYHPNAVARSMITRKTNTIGLVVPDVRNPFFSELARGVEDALSSRGYSLFLCNTDSSIKKEERYIELLKSRFADGIILTTQNNEEANPVFGDFLKEHYPFVFIERYVPGLEGIPGVFVNNHLGAYRMTEYLISLGHRELGCITGPPATRNARDRLQGFRDACTEYGIEVRDDAIAASNYKYEGGYSRMHHWLSHGRKPPFTALFASNDLMALGAYQAADEAGLSVPADISIAGFDNISFPDVMKPRLTSVNLPAYEMGEKAVELMSNSMTSGPENCTSFTYELEIVDKGSVRRL